jgi:RNA recognition motif-containing protein
MPPKIFIGSIPGDTNPEDLLRLLRQHATVIRVSLAFEKKKKASLCKGYGFALCQSEADLQALLSLKDRLYYRDRLISLREFEVGSQLREHRLAFNMRRIFVGNVPEATSIEALHGVFARFGAINNIYFVKGDQVDGCRFGYVVYEEVEAARRALDSREGFFIGPQLLRVEEFGGKRAFVLKQKSGLAPESQKKNSRDQPNKPIHKKRTRDEDEEPTDRSKLDARSVCSDGLLPTAPQKGKDGTLNLAAGQAAKTVSRRKPRQCAKSGLINDVSRDNRSSGAAASDGSHGYLGNKKSPPIITEGTTSTSIQTPYRQQRLTEACVEKTKSPVSTGFIPFHQTSPRQRQPIAGDCDQKFTSNCIVSESHSASLTLLSFQRDASKIAQNHKNPANLRFNVCRKFQKSTRHAIFRQSAQPIAVHHANNSNLVNSISTAQK